MTTSQDDLVRSDGTLTLGVTDKTVLTIYLYAKLKGELLRKVLLHELTHAFIFSYGYYLTIEEEEFICSFMDTYAWDLTSLTDNLLHIGISVRYI